MEKIDVACFHGFLGNPSDWEGVRECLISDVNFSAASLLSDLKNITGDLGFTSWAKYKNEYISKNQRKKILVGYSLGGRILMHLDLSSVDGVILIGSHPGLCEGRDVRLAQDQKWIAKADKISQEQWLQQWNGQPVFNKDQVRPSRSFLDDEFRAWLKIMDHFSLGRQKPIYSRLREYKDKIFWICGEEDSKFMALKERMEEELGASHIFTIPQAGHGVIFDNPQAVAEIVDQVVSYVS